MRLSARTSALALTLVLAACGNNRSSTNGNNNNGDLDSFDFDTSDAADVEEDRNWNDQGGQDTQQNQDVEPDPDAQQQRDVERDPDAQQQQDVERDPDAQQQQDVERDADVPEPDADAEPDVPAGRECAILFAEGEGDFFGSAVALNRTGDRLAAGAQSNSGGGERAGHVRVFERAAGEWTQVGSDIDGTISAV